MFGGLGLSSQHKSSKHIIHLDICPTLPMLRETLTFPGLSEHSWKVAQWFSFVHFFRGCAGHRWAVGRLIRQAAAFRRPSLAHGALATRDHLRCIASPDWSHLA